MGTSLSNKMVTNSNAIKELGQYPTILASRLVNNAYVHENTKLNARLALRQRADLLVANISTNRISLPQGQSIRTVASEKRHFLFYQGY